MSESCKIMNERNPRDHVTYLLARTRVVKKTCLLIVRDQRT